MKRYAIIDVGSNSIHLCIYQCVVDSTISGEVSASPVKVHDEKNMAGLASYVVQGAMTDGGIGKAAEVLLEMKSYLDSCECDGIYVFATAAIRNCSNSKEVKVALENKTGLFVDILSGEDEAHLGFVGAEISAAADSYCVLVDIGGASTELTLSQKGKEIESISIPLGSLSLKNQTVSQMLPTKEEVERAALLMREQLSLIDHWPHLSSLFGIGGTVRATLKVGKAFREDETDEEGWPMNVASLQFLKSFIKLSTSNPEEALDLICNVAPERLQTFIPGCVILATCMDFFQVNECQVRSKGLREGYLIERVLGQTYPESNQTCSDSD